MCRQDSQLRHVPQRVQSKIPQGCFLTRADAFIGAHHVRQESHLRHVPQLATVNSNKSKLQLGCLLTRADDPLKLITLGQGSQLRHVLHQAQSNLSWDCFLALVDASIEADNVVLETQLFEPSTTRVSVSSPTQSKTFKVVEIVSVDEDVALNTRQELQLQQPNIGASTCLMVAKSLCNGRRKE